MMESQNIGHTSLWTSLKVEHSITVLSDKISPMKGVHAYKLVHMVLHGITLSKVNENSIIASCVVFK